MNITLGSLGERDLVALEHLNLLPEDVDLKEVSETAAQSSTENSVPIDRARHGQLESPSNTGMLSRTSRYGTSSGITWFEDMVEDGHLGRIMKRKGQGASADGRTVVQWEVTEYDGEEDRPELATVTPSKRKARDIAKDDVDMKK